MHSNGNSLWVLSHSIHFFTLRGSKFTLIPWHNQYWTFTSFENYEICILMHLIPSAQFINKVHRIPSSPQRLPEEKLYEVIIINVLFFLNHYMLYPATQLYLNKKVSPSYIWYHIIGYLSFVWIFFLSFILPYPSLYPLHAFASLAILLFQCFMICSYLLYSCR